jgi:hypothetical protein
MKISPLCKIYVLAMSVSGITMYQYPNICAIPFMRNDITNLNTPFEIKETRMIETEDKISDDLVDFIT